MRLIISGSRDFNDYKLLDTILNQFNKSRIDYAICGETRGADKLGKMWCIENLVPVCLMPALWEEQGKSAGFKRNKRMATTGTHLIAFWDGKSKGTKNMIEEMKSLDKPVYVIDITNKNAQNTILNIRYFDKLYLFQCVEFIDDKQKDEYTELKDHEWDVKLVNKKSALLKFTALQDEVNVALSLLRVSISEKLYIASWMYNRMLK